ncbi:unnamed protein product [Parnassius mnemosyne]
MDSGFQPYTSKEVNMSWMEKIVLFLADEFNIRLRWNIKDAAIFTTGFAIIGTAIGGYNGGKVGAAIGAGVGGVTGLAVSTVISLREAWEWVKYYLKELYYIIVNFLRRLEPEDYYRAFKIVLTSVNIRKELVLIIISVIEEVLKVRGGRVVSSITTS